MMGNIMSKPVSKLIDLEIDEVSVVDRGANQHSLIAFSKSLAEADVQEDAMSDVALFNEAGEQIDLDTLEHGQQVFSADGEEFVFIEDGREDEILAADPDDSDDDEDDEVDPAAESDDDFGKAFAVGAGGAAEKVGSSLATLAGPAKRYGAKEQFKWGYKTKFKGDPSKNSLAYNAGSHLGRNKKKYAIGATVAGGAAAAGGAYSMSKSLSEEILAEFSKAVTDRDREQVVAKMASQVEEAQEIAKSALEWAEAEHDARMTEAFISKAAEYNLPVSPEVFGPILKSIAEALDEEQLEVLDEIFNAVGDALYDEIGYVGESSNSSVIDQVDALANEYIGKSDASHAQVITAMFEANPAAYDAYISEMGR